MYWQEDDDGQHNADRVTDLSFSIDCRHLPVDHAWPLSQALLELLPWLAEESGAGMHPIHLPEAGNGWMRSDQADDLLHLSKRSKLILRVPLSRREDAGSLVGERLRVAGHDLTITKVVERALTVQPVLFARHLVIGDEQSEEDFLAQIAGQLAETGIRARKMLPGKGKIIRTPRRDLHTLSLMLADLKPEDSIKLQQQGLGEHRHLGCGLFIPHKGISEVRSA